MSVWIVFTKSTPLANCPIDMDGCDFYYAEAFIKSDSKLPSFNESVAAALLDISLELEEVTKVIKFDEAEWGDSEYDLELKKLAKNATESITFSGFRSEEIQEELTYSITGIEEE